MMSCRKRSQTMCSPFHLLVVMSTLAHSFAPAQHPPPRRATQRRAVEPTLGVDFGLRRTGVCVGRGYASRPLEVVENCGNLTAHAAAIVALALREGATAFVVGLPLDRDGSETEQSGLSRAFAARLADVAALLVRDATSVVLWDERFSSREAEALLASGQQKRAKFPTSKAPISAVFRSFRLIFGRAIISRSALEAWVLFPKRARAENSR